MSKLITGILVALVVLLAAFSGYAINQPAEVKEINITTTEFVFDNETAAKVDALAEKLASLDEFQNEADENLQNDTAKDLVLSEKDKKDFKLAILDVLEGEGFDVESYKDLTIYAFKIEGVELSDEDAEVKVVFKVSGFESGDEEDAFKVRLNATFIVSELIVDEDFEDSEVSEYEIVFEKKYD